jgi:hypothetical protein
MGDTSDVESINNSKFGNSIGSKTNNNGGKVKKAAKKATNGASGANVMVHRNIPV